MSEQQGPPYDLLGLAALAAGGLAYLAAKVLVKPKTETPAGTDANHTHEVGELGPCYFCGKAGGWCDKCGVYKCPEHGGPAWAAVGAATKALGVTSWHGDN